MSNLTAREAEARLPRPPGVIRRAVAAHPVAVDVFIVVWYFIGVLLGVSLDFLAATAADTENPLYQGLAAPSYMDWPWNAMMVLRVLVIAAALLFRRRFPLLGLIAVTLATLGPQGAISAANGVAILFLLYAVPVYRGVAAAWGGYFIALVGTFLQYWIDSALSARPVAASGTEGLVAQPNQGTLSVGQMIVLCLITGLWYLAVVMFGVNLGNRRRYLAAIIDRAHQLVRERDQLAQLAVAEERSRIAREMHDIVAHSVSVMIALSEGASRTVETAPAKAASAMQRSAEAGRSALAEMRRLLGALNTSDGAAELVPQPGIEQLPELVESFRSAGLQVSLRVAGAASGDRGQELAAYRVVQEGLTNVLRYAGVGAVAEVTLREGSDGVAIEVRDHGRRAGSTGPTSGVGSGRGLAGLAERVRVFGGSIDAGPAVGGSGPDESGPGWLLRAFLPVNTEAVPAASAEPAAAVPAAAEPAAAEEPREKGEL